MDKLDGFVRLPIASSSSSSSTQQKNRKKEQWTNEAPEEMESMLCKDSNLRPYECELSFTRLDGQERVGMMKNIRTSAFVINDDSPTELNGLDLDHHISPIEGLDPDDPDYSFSSAIKLNNERRRRRPRSFSDGGDKNVRDELFPSSFCNVEDEDDERRYQTSENFYSHISDYATVPGPCLFIPPPPVAADPLPPMPPRLPLNGKMKTSTTQTVEWSSYQLQPLYHDYNGGDIDSGPRFIMQGLSDCCSHPRNLASTFPANNSFHESFCRKKKSSAVDPAKYVMSSRTTTTFDTSRPSSLAAAADWSGFGVQNLNAKINLPPKQLPRGQQQRPVASWYETKKQSTVYCQWRAIALAMLAIAILLTLISAYLVGIKLHDSALMDEDNDKDKHDSAAKLFNRSGDILNHTTTVQQLHVGTTLNTSILPLEFWMLVVYLPEAHFIRFHFSLNSNAVIGVYGRKNTPPTHTQHDFFHVGDSRFTADIDRRHTRQISALDADVFEMTFVEFLEIGVWYIFVYNDCNQSQEDVKVFALLYDTFNSSCPKKCHGRGDCVDGKCLCFSGYTGSDCFQRNCPVICQGHGQYVRGRCECYRGWKGHECEQLLSDDCVDAPCGGNGVCLDGRCVCSPGFVGANCSEESCYTDCLNGHCRGHLCDCQHGWIGRSCDVKECDSRCSLHGVCRNGSCECKPGWNGKHCSLDGCPEYCRGHGLCTINLSQWKCNCTEGWAGVSCGTSLEVICNDNQDDDRDSLIDCQDPDCCSSAACRNSVQCKGSPDPLEILLRKQPSSGTASFFERVSFLIEENSIQSQATVGAFNQSHVSVIRGKVVYGEGIPMIGVKVSVLVQPLYGFTLSRESGFFDILVNGGGSVTLTFQRQPFQSKDVTILLPWNRLITMDTVTMTLEDYTESTEAGCSGVDLESYDMKPNILPTQQQLTETSVDCPFCSFFIPQSQVLQETLSIPNTDAYLVYRSGEVSGYMSTMTVLLTPDKIPTGLSIVHLRVLLEGRITDEILEAEPNLKYRFAWGRRNAYNQKVYGTTEARVDVGYEYADCKNVYWEKRSAILMGYAISSSEIGGWDLSYQHTYNFEEGILHRGDGTNVYLKNQPHKVVTVLGDGSTRQVDCRGCNGKAKDGNLMAPVALVSGLDGSLYVGDYNYIRKLSANREELTNILQLGISEIPYKYYIAISPFDGKLYISDYRRLQVIRVKTMGAVRNLTHNYEVIAGMGDQCTPGDAERCGDGGKATAAKLIHPKGIAISKDGVVYFADGVNVRTIDVDGMINTFVGSQDLPKYWNPLPCDRSLSVDEVTLYWPTALSINPLDDTLNILDNNLILKVTSNKRLVIVTGRPLQCPPVDVLSAAERDFVSRSRSSSGLLDHPQHMSFAQNGDLYVVESDGRGLNRIRLLNTDGQMLHYAGSVSSTTTDTNCNRCRRNSSCVVCRETLTANVSLHTPTAVALTPDGVLHVADMGSLQLISFVPDLPSKDRLGQYEVPNPKDEESYVFNRYGQHVATRNTSSNRTLYSFTYDANSYYGKLVRAELRSSGNDDVVLTIQRDYKHQAKEIVLSDGRGCRILTDNLGRLRTFADSSNRTTVFSYLKNTGLVRSKDTSDGRTFWYDYDDSGHLRSVTLPTGETVYVAAAEDDRGRQIASGPDVVYLDSSDPKFSERSSVTTDLQFIGNRPHQDPRES